LHQRTADCCITVSRHASCKEKLSRLVVVAAACKGAASGAGQLRTAAPAKQGHALAISHLVEPPEAGSRAAQGHPELPAHHAALLNSRLMPKHLGVATAS